MKLNKLAWTAFQSGTTSQQLKEAAKDKVDYLLLWILATFAALYYVSWEWAVIPAILAAVNGAQWFDATKLAPEIEALENLIRKTSQG